MRALSPLRSSGESVQYGHITRHGSTILRWTLIQAVHAHLKYAPNSNISIFHTRIAKKRGVGRATVAAASFMLRIIYRMLLEKREFVLHYGQDNSGGIRIE